MNSADEEKDSQLKTDLQDLSVTLLGIITELPTRYHPDGLAASVGSERVGLADWIVDRILGADTDLDEESAKLGIADLCERNLIKITATAGLKRQRKERASLVSTKIERLLKFSLS